MLIFVHIVIQYEIKGLKVDNPTRKRLSVDLHMELHQALKEIALKHNMTVTKIIESMVIQLIKQEEMVN
jgi:predicted DNA-binding ribbon-helix-helix protein